MPRKATLALLVPALLAAALVAPAPVGALPATSPDRQVLVVTANLREAYASGNDLRDNSDMKVFVRRLLEHARYLPDVLLLQEVRRQSTNFVARHMSRKTGRDYVAVVKPPWDIMKEENGTLVHTETAIVINRSTMARKSRGGYIRTTYDRRDAAPGTRVNVKRHAHIAAAERSSGTRIALMSLRFAHNNDLRSASLGQAYRYKWSNKVASFIASKYPGTARAMRVIGGDFNAARCVTKNPCREAAFWKLLTGDRYRYIDAMHHVGEWDGVDFIFARQQVVAGAIDRTYNADRAERGLEPYYSDHKFRWGVIGP